MSSPNSLQINEEKARAGKRKQGKAREREGTLGKPHKRKYQRTYRAAKQEKAMDNARTQGKARDTKGKPESKGEQGIVGKRKGNQAKPERASDRFARGARSARVPGGKARES